MQLTQLKSRIPNIAFSAALAIAGALSAPAPAEAQQQQYPVDVWIQHCEDLPKRGEHSALAYSKMGIQSCIRNSSIRNAKIRAKKDCKQLVPRKMRKKAPCEVIATDTEILEPHLVDLLQKEVRVPVVVEIYDGDTETKQTAKAFVVYGEAITLDKRRVQIVHESGAELCDGNYKHSRQKVYFEMKCFDQYRFRDQVSKAQGYFLSNGVYVPVFATKLERNASYINIVPPEATTE